MTSQFAATENGSVPQVPGARFTSSPLVSVKFAPSKETSLASTGASEALNTGSSKSHSSADASSSSETAPAATGDLEEGLSSARPGRPVVAPTRSPATRPTNVPEATSSHGRERHGASGAGDPSDAPSRDVLGERQVATRPAYGRLRLLGGERGSQSEGAKAPSWAPRTGLGSALGSATRASRRRPARAGRPTSHSVLRSGRRRGPTPSTSGRRGPSPARWPSMGPHIR